MSKKRVVKILTCGFCIVLCILTSILPIFAFDKTDATQEELGSLNYEIMPFLSWHFSVAGTSGVQNQGFYYLPHELFAYDSFDFLICGYDNFRIEMVNNRSGGYHKFYVPSESGQLVLEFRKRYVGEVSDPAEGVSYDKFECTLNLVCSDGRYYDYGAIDSGGIIEFGKFNMRWICGYAYQYVGGDSVIYVEPYREGQYALGGIVQRAPFGSVSLGNTTYDGLTELTIDFFLPLEFTENSLSATSFDINLRFLLSCCNFDLSLVPGFAINNGYKRQYAWKFTTGIEAFYEGIGVGHEVGLEEGRAQGYQMGLNDGIDKSKWHIGTLISGIFEGQYNLFSSILDFDIPIGNTVINFATIAGMLIALMLIIVVVRFILK